MARTRPRGRQEVIDALLASSRRLIAERGPSVALRDIAEDAGVNFGLLYHYFGTKDQLVDIVYQAAAESMADRLAGVANLDEAIGQLMRAGDGTAARLIVWAVLEGRGAAPAFRNSPPLEILADLMQRDGVLAGRAITDDEARVFSAFAMTTALGWRLFAETALLAAGIEDPLPERYADRILGYVQDLAAQASRSDTAQ